MKILGFLLTFCLMSVISSADELTWNTLAARPDLWPSQCTMKATIPFQGGVTVATGQTVIVDRFSPNDVQVTTLDNQTSFAADPNEVDCLDVANKAYAALTPKQQTLSYISLIQHKELWPASIIINRDLDFPGNHHLIKGSQVKVMSMDSGSVLVLSEALKGEFRILPSATNLMLQARTLVENNQALPTFLAEQQKQAVAKEEFNENRLVYDLKGKLINVATNQQQPLDPNATPRYFVFMRGSSTCSITHKFIPDLVRFYNQTKPQHPEFEIVYIEYDTLGDAAKFSQQQGFSSWRALAYENTPSIPNSVIAGPLPQLFVMDRSGKLLINGIQNDAPKALEKIKALLNNQ
jgi:hypothetical protein